MPFTLQDLSLTLEKFYTLYLQPEAQRLDQKIQEMQEAEDWRSFRKGAVRLWEYERK